MPVIGFLNASSRDTNEERLRAFHLGLRERGFVEGDNVIVLYRWAEGQLDQLPGLAADLARRRVAVLATFGNATAFAAKAATTAVPVVFAVSEPVTVSYRARLAELALEHRLPGMFGTKENVEAGGLMSYSADFNDIVRRAAAYIDKILKGAKPADLPVEQASKYELVINLRNAKTMGVEISPLLLARADEVIE